MRKPLAVELFCGTFGWSRGWLEMGGRVIGYDIEHLPHHGPVPEGANLILQDVHTIDGWRLKDADLILASPPCPEFSYMAMPWKRGRQIAEALRGRGDFPAGYKGSRTIEELTALFRACFRIQAEASAAAGRYIPLVVENVKGAQPWVGKARWLYGSFALWGDVPILMPKPHRAHKDPFRSGRSSHQAADMSGWRSVRATKNEGVKVAGLANGRFPPGGLAQGAIEAHKVVGHVNKRDGHAHTRHLKNQAEHDAVKGFKDFHDAPMCQFGSKSSARKAASARIAMIPERLSRHIAGYYFPQEMERSA